MLVVRAEIWPSGDESRAVVIGTITAANVSELAATSTYEVCMDQMADRASGAKGINAALTVAGHRRSDGVWALVRRIIDVSRSADQDETHS